MQVITDYWSQMNRSLPISQQLWVFGVFVDLKADVRGLCHIDSSQLQQLQAFISHTHHALRLLIAVMSWIHTPSSLSHTPHFEHFVLVQLSVTSAWIETLCSSLTVHIKSEAGTTQLQLSDRYTRRHSAHTHRNSTPTPTQHTHISLHLLTSSTSSGVI